MSFDLFLQDMNDHVSQADWIAARDAAFSRHSVQKVDDAVLRFGDGAEIEFFQSKDHPGGTFALRGWSNEVGNFIFDLLDSSKLFLLCSEGVIRSGLTLRPPFPEEGYEEALASSGEELETLLLKGFDVWKEFRDRRAGKMNN
ncbi:MAG: hypothetical protein GC208_08020 [Alphaproteobacteria bacterium]|nr:hypothetical protein [Alphaproteobacteria bacterium]